MKLFFKKTGEGKKPLVILHGLFGLGDNWSSLAKAYAENGFTVYLFDLRNHGRSPHDDAFSYELMAEDVLDLLNDEGIEKADFIGHSMGGKVLMFFSEKYFSRMNTMIVVDIAPRYYPPHHQSIVLALKSIDTKSLTNRKEAEEKLRIAIHDESMVQFLMKNLYWKEENRLDWRFYLKGIVNNIEEVGKPFNPDKPIKVRVLFIKGSNSGYINETDEKDIKRIFPLASIVTVEGAGHWVHAEKPKEFLEKTLMILK
jgi:pimeloyl-ACP methyl ester carboxylesterase